MTWKELAELLASRLAHCPECSVQGVSDLDLVNCPFCKDFHAYELYLFKAGKIRFRIEGRMVSITELANGADQKIRFPKEDE